MSIMLNLEPIASDIPVDVRLRRLLKFALRGCQLKAIDVRDVSEHDQQRDRLPDCGTAEPASIQRGERGEQ